jgi:hypothetical protein
LAEEDSEDTKEKKLSIWKEWRNLKMKRLIG